MDAAIFVFTCDCNFRLIADYFRKEKMPISSDLDELLNQHLADITRIFLPKIIPSMIEKVHLKLDPGGNSKLEFSSYHFRYTMHGNDYLVISKGKFTRLPIIVEIKASSSAYDLKLH